LATGSDNLGVREYFFLLRNLRPATCDSIPKLKIDWDKVDKEEYKKNVKVELEDFRYLKMKTPHGDKYLHFPHQNIVYLR
jgi:hypothetical protein